MPKKPIMFVNEPVFIEDNGTARPYIPIEVQNNRDAYSVSLDILFKHVADVHYSIITIVAEKYNISVDEIVNVIKEDERFNAVKRFETPPMINGMGYVANYVESVAPPPPTTTTEAPKKRVVSKKVVSSKPAQPDVEEVQEMIAPLKISDVMEDESVQQPSVQPVPPPSKIRVAKKRVS